MASVHGAVSSKGLAGLGKIPTVAKVAKEQELGSEICTAAAPFHISLMTGLCDYTR